MDNGLEVFCEDDVDVDIDEEDEKTTTTAIYTASC